MLFSFFRLRLSSLCSKIVGFILHPLIIFVLFLWFVCVTFCFFCVRGNDFEIVGGRSSGQAHCYDTWKKVPLFLIQLAIHALLRYWEGQIDWQCNEIKRLSTVNVAIVNKFVPLCGQRIIALYFYLVHNCTIFLCSLDVGNIDEI